MNTWLYSSSNEVTPATCLQYLKSNWTTVKLYMLLVPYFTNLHVAISWSWLLSLVRWRLSRIVQRHCNTLFCHRTGWLVSVFDPTPEFLTYFMTTGTIWVLLLFSIALDFLIIFITNLNKIDCLHGFLLIIDYALLGNFF